MTSTQTQTGTQIVTGYDRVNGQRVPQTLDVVPGMFLSEMLVTDSIVWEVVKTTPKSVTLRPTAAGDQVHDDEKCDKGAHGLSVQWTERVSNPNAETKTLRVRKDGTIRFGDHAGARPMYKTPQVDGKPVSRRDWRF
jgi:hypothetical protein